MPNIIVTDRSGEETTVEADIGGSVMEAIRDGGLEELEALCGGARACATCHVYVAEDWFDKLPAVESEEQDLLQFSEYHQTNSRLSCQIKVDDSLDGMRVEIAPAD